MAAFGGLENFGGQIGVITRKEWYLTYNSADLFDDLLRISDSRSYAQCTRDDLERAFKVLADGKRMISLDEFISRASAEQAPAVPTHDTPEAKAKENDIRELLD